MLSGVGVPDLRGSQSKGTFYTQDKSVVAEENEQLIFLDAGCRHYDAGDRPAQYESVAGGGYFLRNARPRGQGSTQTR